MLRNIPQCVRQSPEKEKMTGRKIFRSAQFEKLAYTKVKITENSTTWKQTLLTLGYTSFSFIYMRVHTQCSANWILLMKIVFSPVCHDISLYGHFQLAFYIQPDKMFYTYLTQSIFNLTFYYVSLPLFI